MPETFNAFGYVRYMRSRGLWIAASCGVAAILALAGSMALPRQYTATARVVIEPPAGTDLRSAMAVSPIYLESLRTYEEFAVRSARQGVAADRVAEEAHPQGGDRAQYARHGDFGDAAGRAQGSGAGAVCGGVDGGVESLDDGAKR